MDAIAVDNLPLRRRAADRGQGTSVFLLRWEWNWPNFFTASRFVLVPFQIFFLLVEKPLWALALYVCAGVSDFLDGFLARRLNQRTEGGAILDPLADKFTMMATFLTLMGMGIIPVWLAVLVFSRDIFILLAVAILLKGRRRIPWKAMVLGKVTTCFQNITILAAILRHYLSFPASLFQGLAIATALLTVASWIRYFQVWKKIWTAPKEAMLTTIQRENAHGSSNRPGLHQNR